MRKIVLLYIGICFWSSSFGQIRVLNLPSNPFQKKKEISGIAVSNDTLFMASEKCKKIYLLSKTRFDNIDSIDLSNLLPDGAEIEGLALVGNKLYMTDEGNCKIWVYDLSQRSMVFLRPSPSINLGNFRRHMEGIAIKGDSLYLLKDNNGHSQSEIHLFNIDFQTLQMSYVCKILIDNANSLRYSDIFFDSPTGRLIGIKSSLQEYFIDELNITSVRADTTISSNSFRHLYTLTDTVHNNRSRYATNLEGITCDQKFIYVISDNSQDVQLCQQLGVLPLFLKILKTY